MDIQKCGWKSRPELFKLLGVCHIAIFGMENAEAESYKDNIRLLSGLGARYFIRIPLIREVNADRANLDATIRFLTSLPNPPEEVDLLPYHDIGKGKHERLGTVYNPQAFALSAPSKEEQDRCVRQFVEAGLTVRLGG